MKKKLSFLIATLFLGALSSCGKSTTVSIDYTGDEESVKFAIEEIKTSLKQNKLKYVNSGGDYQIIINNSTKGIAKEGYKIKVENNTINVLSNDSTGLMYGGLQLAENISLNKGIVNLQNFEESPYLEYRGVSIRPPMDLRTPSYTNNGDSTRWNLENTWDLDFWQGLFDRMAKMRYNLLSFATVNSLANMVKVPGYEDCAIDDVLEYTGSYDDTYLGDCTNMYRPEHMQEGNYRVVKKITIDEKIAFWKQVMEAAHNRGIHWQMSTMNIYTFAENGKYGITDARDNEVTKDYFRKAYTQLIKTYPYIDQLKTTCGENMVAEKGTEDISNKWYRYVYGGAIEDAFKDNPEKGKNFLLGFAGVGNTKLTQEFYDEFNDYPYPLYVNKRYNDTRLLSVSKCTDNDEYIKNMPEGWNMIYNVRGEDAYHLTWGDPDFARDFAKNSKKDRVLGWHFAIDGYYVSGKEYEFVDDSLNGGYYYDRHWIMYTMFGRFAYNPEITNETWQKIVENHYRDVKTEIVDLAWKAMNTAGKIMPNIICQFAPGGTDAAFLPEMCTSHPTLGGFLGVKKMINSNLADPDGDIYSFSEYANLLSSGVTKLEKRTPFDVANDLRTLSSEVLKDVEAALNKLKGKNTELENLLLDQKLFAYLGNYYADKFEGTMNLRIYNDTKDTNYQEKAIKNLESALENWKLYANLFSSRFKEERLPRHGVINPNNLTAAVTEDINTAKTWKCRTY